MNFSTSVVQGRDGGQRACTRTARSPLQMSCRLPPGRCTPRGLFMSRGQTLMGDSGSTRRVIRTADGLVRFRPRCVVRVHVSPPAFVRRRFLEKSEEHCLLLLRLYFLPLSFKSPSRMSFVYAACSRVRTHRSDKVSPRVRMKERARQTEGKAKWQTRGRGLCYSHVPVCSRFVSLLSLCQCGSMATQWAARLARSPPLIGSRYEVGNQGQTGRSLQK